MSLDVAALGLRTAAPAQGREQRQTLGQEDFLTLLVTQLRNQDPLNPLDNEAFVAQLAQFSTVSGITEMNRSLSTLAQLADADARAGAPGWVGRSVSGTNGSSGIVTAVGFAADGSLTLDLDSGTTLPLAAVAKVA